MQNLLLILGILVLAIAVIVPLLERVAKPVDEEQAGRYSRIITLLMGVLVLAWVIKFFMH